MKSTTGSIRRIASAVLFLFLIIGCEKKEDVTSKKPNIVIIYLDDLGYGDLSSYGATQIHTPNMDRLVNEGIKFTNGYASSATCTPSRYALLTGTYPWRRNLRVVQATSAMIIDTAAMTLPKMLQSQGYHTGIVGKWHLGMGAGSVDWNNKITLGPNEIGFDFAHVMAATQDRVPSVYIENGLVVNLDASDPLEVDYKKNFDDQPTGKDNPELLSVKWHHGHNGSIVNGISRIGYMKGGRSAHWSDVDMADHFLEEAQSYIREHKDEPFFLYYAMQQPHVPRTPHPRFVGATDLGARGDVIVEADWCVGQLLNTLEEEELMENTLIIFSSDNGPVLQDGYFDEADTRIGEHDPAGGLRGGKYSLFEAGARVPFATYWRGTIQPSVSEAVVSQIDILNSLAQLTGSEVRVEDGHELLNVFLGISDEGRKELVLEAIKRTALRQGDWVMIPPYPGRKINPNVNIELGNGDDFLLYNLKEDSSQQRNLAGEHPEKLRDMVEAYKALRGEAYYEGLTLALP